MAAFQLPGLRQWGSPGSPSRRQAVAGGAATCRSEFSCARRFPAVGVASVPVPVDAACQRAARRFDQCQPARVFTKCFVTRCRRSASTAATFQPRFNTFEGLSCFRRWGEAFRHSNPYVGGPGGQTTSALAAEVIRSGNSSRQTAPQNHVNDHGMPCVKPESTFTYSLFGPIRFRPSDQGHANYSNWQVSRPAQTPRLVCTFRLVKPIDRGPEVRRARDASGFGIIGLEGSIRANAECVGECRDGRGGAVV